MESRLTALEKEVGQTLDSLKSALGGYRDKLKTSRARKAQAKERLDKLAALRKETADTLKKLVKNIDLLKKDLLRSREELSRLKREETVVKGKYLEMLTGRLPGTGKEEINGAFDSLFEKDKEELAARKEQFLATLSGAFSELEGRLKEMEDKRKRLTEKTSQADDGVKSGERKREILFEKLSIYRSETVELERTLAIAAVEEEKLFAEYSGFVSRFKNCLNQSQKAKPAGGM